MNVEFGGTRCGSNTYDYNSDGTFTSTTDFAIGTIKFHSIITGQFVGGKLVRYAADADVPGAKVVLDWDGSKIKVTQGGKTAEKELKFDGDSYFGNIHPQLNMNLLRSIDYRKKEPQKVKTLLLDSGVVFEPSAKPLKEKPSKAGIARLYEMHLGAVVAEYATDSMGRVVAMDVPSQKLRFVTEGWESLFVDPLAAYPELSQPTMATTTDRNVKMKTRDGVDLAMDIVRPAAPGKYPVILVRTPYGRGPATVDGGFYASRGYVFIAQDCRGRGESTGEWDPFVNERKDGYDAIDWASKQAWSDGKVGMIGASYGGLVQWAAAVERHPALKAIVPQVSPPDAMRNIPYDMGTFFLYGNLWWGKIVRNQADVDMSSMASSLPHPEKFGTLPLSRVDDAVLGYNVPFFDKWLEREGSTTWPGYDWSTQLDRTNVPALHISGWWDGDLIGTQTNWASLRAAKKPNQWLIYGPWTHAFNTTSTLGDVDYGPTAIMELDSLYLRWFDTWLKGKSVAMEKVPKVRVFITGANKWMDLDDWPSTKSAERTLYLYADAPANGGLSKGELRDQPAISQEPSRYLFNPADAKVPKELLEVDPSKATTTMNVGEEDDDSLLFKS
ncbi:MAG: CocE/NonD family hydrolase, partial [Fimbriimonas sp.]